MAGHTKPHAFAPTAEQLLVLERIAQQRERIRARRTAITKSAALAQSQPKTIPSAAPVSFRVVALALRYPLAGAAVAGVALVIGPRRMVRWTEMALPLFNRLQPFLNRRG